MIKLLGFPVAASLFAMFFSLSPGAVQTQDSATGSTASAVPSWALYQGANQGGNLVGLVADPCAANVKLYVAISQTANTKLVTGTSSKKIYICSVNIVAAAANNIALVDGTGSVCASSPVAVDGLGGGGTAATGWNFAANGGLTYGNGASAIGVEHVAADDLCLYNSGATQVSGGLTYVVQ